MNRITVAVIPCYNVAKHCEEVFRGAAANCSHVLVINDGSTDETARVAKNVAQEVGNLHLIEFEKNRGKGYALDEGFKYALANWKFDALITVDGDGQHIPSLIPALAAPIFEGADLVIGKRKLSEMPMKNKCANLLIAILLRIVYPKAPLDTQSGMRAHSYSFLKEITHWIHGGSYEMEFRILLLALRNKRTIQSITIPTIYIDNNKTSHYRFLFDSVRIFTVLITHLFGKI